TGGAGGVGGGGVLAAGGGAKLAPPPISPPLADLLAGGGIPDAHHAALIPADQDAAILREGERPQTAFREPCGPAATFFTRQHLAGPAAGGVPQAHDEILRVAGDRLAVRREGDRDDVLDDR